MGRHITVTGAGRSIPSLPQRLVALAGAVGTVQHPGQPVRHHLQTGWTMTAQERAEAANLITTLTSSLDPAATFEGKPGPEAKAALLTKVIKGLGGAAEVSDLVAAAKVEMYADQIDVIPAWAIDIAIKRWGAGNCPADIEERPNYNFPPSPAALRKMAMLELDLPRRYVAMLTNLVDAITMERALSPDPMPKEFGVGPALRRM